MSRGDIAYQHFIESLEKYNDYYGKGQRKKSEMELHIEQLEEKRKQTLNKYCGFDAY